MGTDLSIRWGVEEEEAEAEAEAAALQRLQVGTDPPPGLGPSKDGEWGPTP